MSKIEALYDAWYKCWVTSYVPLLLERPKWKHEHENLQINDVVYFKMTDSPLGASWKLGKVEDVKIGKDRRVREVLIAYKIMDEEEDSWRHSTVWRPVRECIKLFHMEDTTFMDDLREVRKKAEEILFEKKEESFKVTVEEDDQSLIDKKKKKKRSTELEQLQLQELDGSLPRLRSQVRAHSVFLSCHSLSSWDALVHTADGGQTGSAVEGVLRDAEFEKEENDYDKFDEIMFLL